MTFKESLENSNDDFFDQDVFAEEHELEYRKVKCVLDTDIHGRDGNHEEGKNDIRIFLSTKECDRINLEPMSQGQSINVDGTEYIVQSWAHEMGVYVIYAYRYGEQVIL